ncbi:MAG: hypothetical protein JXR88_06955 [Clostridia bacterium]|nr:hypothetical protein [Clostridia bacterium]
MIEGYVVRDRGRIIKNIVYNELIRRGYHVFVGVDIDLKLILLQVKIKRKYIIKLRYPYKTRKLKQEN